MHFLATLKINEKEKKKKKKKEDLCSFHTGTLESCWRYCIENKFFSYQQSVE